MTQAKLYQTAPHKRQNLQRLLRWKGLPGEVYFSRKFLGGWMITMPDGSVQRIAENYQEAIVRINKGDLFS